MTHSSHWSIGLGIATIVVCGVLATIGAAVSDGEADPATDPDLPSAAPPSPAAAPTRSQPAMPSAHPTTAEIPGIASGSRRVAVESVVRPLLEIPRLRSGVFGIDLGNGSYFDLNGSESFAAASLIKIPIAVALLSAVDREAISLDEKLELKVEQLAAGSGGLQYQPVGTSFTVRRLGELMIRRSDNTATNMLIDRLGGIEGVNAIFEAWGLTRTVLRSPLPDMEGTNRTSPRDLVTIIGRAVGGEALGRPSRDLLLSWMRRTHVRSLLPSGAGRGSIVANKTGDIPGALGDAAYVESPGGHRYLLAVQVERPRNSHRAKEVIRSVSRIVYRSMTNLPAPVSARPGRLRASFPRRSSAPVRGSS